MADVYEIAERVVDMHKHTPGCSVVPCPCTTCKLARHVLATRGVVEAAVNQAEMRKAYGFDSSVMRSAVWDTNAAVRAMKEKRDHE